MEQSFDELAIINFTNLVNQLADAERLAFRKSLHIAGLIDKWNKEALATQTKI